MSGKCNFFQVREKSGNAVAGQGNLETTWKVREFEDKWLWHTVFRKFMYSVQEGKGCTEMYMRQAKAISLLIGGYSSRKEFAPFFTLRVTPKFEVIQFAPLKKRMKMIFFICERVWKTVKCQGKIREKSGNFEVDD